MARNDKDLERRRDAEAARQEKYLGRKLTPKELLLARTVHPDGSIGNEGPKILQQLLRFR
jgi:hypothetical protein